MILSIHDKGVNGCIPLALFCAFIGVLFLCCVLKRNGGIKYECKN